MTRKERGEELRSSGQKKLRDLEDVHILLLGASDIYSNSLLLDRPCVPYTHAFPFPWGGTCFSCGVAHSWEDTFAPESK